MPEIGAVMERHGWGSLASGVVAFPGRNDNWAGTTSAGVGVFVKKIDGRDAAARFCRALSFARLGQAAAGVASPACIASDEASRVLVFELLEGSRNGNVLERDGLFTHAMAGEAGRMVGRLHRIPVTDGALDTTVPSWPRLDGLQALTICEFTSYSGAQLELFGLLQKDAPLVSAIAGLGDLSRQVSAVPTHCDLRLDQFLIHQGKLYLADWEELRVEDPARDVGAFLGEWVYRSVHAIRHTGQVTAEAIISSGVRELESRRPFLQAFWSGYQEMGEVTDPSLAPRSAAFAGWHLLDRILAASTERARLSALDRAGIGIARRLLCSPDLFCDVLGLPVSPKGAR
ncbi:class V lanthionine synthetase subunit LxmK [Streptomyces sp. NBC_01619]|uniref:class V lanthionine synthetase subunit LxmK n=1 Tax=Streptomyces sp. NBC_01619 TaxID=2975901 RepID=UPI002255B6D8|nr:class V lanthionine synthetase subunit LxmK [Streptomyces sp. NBC_01619]